MQLGLFERRAGRALRVALAEAAGAQFDRALAEAANELPRIARLLADDDAERTAVVRATARDPPGRRQMRHILVVRRAGEADREVPIGAEPLIIGHAGGSGVRLDAIEVSRAHVHIMCDNGVVTVTDLNSTNGTLIEGRPRAGTVVLGPAAVLQIGPYRLEYQREGSTDETEDPEATMRASRSQDRVAALHPRRRSPA